MSFNEDDSELEVTLDGHTFTMSLHEGEELPEEDPVYVLVDLSKKRKDQFIGIAYEDIFDTSSPGQIVFFI